MMKQLQVTVWSSLVVEKKGLRPLIVIGDGAVLDFTARDSDLLVVSHLVLPIFDKVNAITISKFDGFHLVAGLGFVENDRTVLAKVRGGHPLQQVWIAFIPGPVVL